MMASKALLDACVQFVADVSPEAVARVVTLIETEGVARAGVGLSGDASQRYAEVTGAWASCSEPPLATVVGSLLSGAAHAVATQRSTQQVELVWSGPTTISSTLRSTGPALLELIRGAVHSVYLVAFAAYRVPEVVEAIGVAIQKGVRFVFVLENESVSGGKVNFDPLPHLLGEAAQHVQVFIWPSSQRRRDARGRHGTLHAKFAVADRRRLLISSANLTADAFDLNIELGAVLSGGTAPREAAAQIDELIRRGVLQLYSSPSRTGP